MNITHNMPVNQLPARTWNFLKVNEAVLPWPEQETIEPAPIALVAAEGETVRERLTVSGQGAGTRQMVWVQAAAGSDMTVFETFRGDCPLAVQTRLDIGQNARVHLVQVQLMAAKGLLYNRIDSQCARDGRLEVTQIYVGKCDLYADTQVCLPADGGSLKADIGYLGRANQTLDMNLSVVHQGKHTQSEINAAGALRDAARKIFRGTIDFQQGCADSTGDEKETVLMLGDDAVNKTVPLILCAEENVVGNHGATIGQLDADTLFYFESRGIAREQAEEILARAALERLARGLNDPETEEAVQSALEEEACHGA